MTVFMILLFGAGIYGFLCLIEKKPNALRQCPYCVYTQCDMSLECEGCPEYAEKEVCNG